MIAAVLLFLLGFLAALLFALLVAPLVWRRAKSIARREFEATIPSSAREIRGTYDILRARTAFDVRRREMAAEERETRAAFERVEAGRIAGENAELKARTHALSAQVAQQMSELEELNATLSARESEADAIDRELREAHHDLTLRIEEMEALGARFSELSDIAEERKITIVALETRNDNLSDDLRQHERRLRENANVIERLSSEVEVLEAGLSKERQANRRLDEKVTRLTRQLADRDEQLERMFARRRGPDVEEARPRGASAALGESDGHVRDAAKAGDGRNAETTADKPQQDRQAVVPKQDGAAAVELGGEGTSALSPDRAGLDADPARGSADQVDRRAALASIATAAAALPHGSNELAEIDDPRELGVEISDIAARVIASAVRGEGRDGPVSAILAKAGDDIAPDSLAGRVKAIRDKRDSEAAE